MDRPTVENNGSHPQSPLQETLREKPLQLTLGEKPTYFPALTGVRAIAAYLVYLHHFNPMEDFSKKLSYFFDELHIGVTFFFVLSGFLIAYRYYNNPSSFRQYILNRFARIYPMYFLLTTLYFVVHNIDMKAIVIYLANISFLRGFFDPYKFSMVAQGWSLTVEETFYFLAPLFFYLILKSRGYLLKLPVILICFGVLQVLVFSKINLFGFMGSFEFLFNYTFWGRCIEFFVGIMLAIQLKNNRTIYHRIKYKTLTGIICILICIGMFTAIRVYFGLDFGIRHPLGIIINTLVLPLAGIGLLYDGLLTENTFVSRILASKLFVLLGKSSYIFYLIHLGMFQMVIYNFVSPYEWPTVIEYPLVFIALNIISILLFLGVEDPLNKFIRKKWGQKTVIKTAGVTGGQ